MFKKYLCHLYFRFDWSGNTPLQYNDRVCLDVLPIDNGTAHAIFLWWDLNMDTEEKVIIIIICIIENNMDTC